MVRVLLVTYLVVLHAVVIYFVGERLARRYILVSPVGEETSVPEITRETPIPSPPPVPESFADPTPDNVNTGANVNSNTLLQDVQSSGLIIPVAGVRSEQLVDTFSESRSEGRSHDAIDIIAPAGAPVVAAADGQIVKLFDSERGGITIYQMTADRKFILYYAHLQRRADGISVGMQVKKGHTIGFVGDTGNSGSGNFHLHFSVAVITDPKRFWEGSYINPYPLLRNGEYPH